MWSNLAMTEPRGLLESAMAIRRRHGERIAVVTGHISDAYEVGYYVIVCPYGDMTVCSVEMPMTPKMVAAQRELGSLLETWLTIVGVPMNRVRIIDDETTKCGDK